MLNFKNLENPVPPRGVPAVGGGARQRHRPRRGDRRHGLQRQGLPGTCDYLDEGSR